jgi:hypothetical protein
LNAANSRKKSTPLLSQADFGLFLHQGWQNLPAYQSGMGVFAFAERQFAVLRNPQKYRLDKNFDRVAWFLGAEQNLPAFLPVRHAPLGRLLRLKSDLPPCPRQQYRQAILSACTPRDITTRHYHDGPKLYALMCSIASGITNHVHQELDQVSILNRGYVPTQTTDHLGEILLDHIPAIASKNFLINAARFRGHRSLHKAFGVLVERDPEQAARAALHIVSRHLSLPDMNEKFFSLAQREFLRNNPSCLRETCTAALNLARRGLIPKPLVERLVRQLGDDPLWESRDRQITKHVQVYLEKSEKLQPHRTYSLELF